MISRTALPVLLLCHVAAAQNAQPQSIDLKYRLAPGDRLVYHERIHREVEAKDGSSAAEAEWDTQLLVLSDPSHPGEFIVGTQRNRTRAELLQDREGGKDKLAKERPEFEERLRRRGLSFSEANRFTAKGAALLPRVAAREWSSMVLLDVRELMPLPDAPVKIGDSWRNNDILGLGFRVEAREELKDEECLRISGENQKSSLHMKFWFCPSSGEMPRLEFDAKYPVFISNVHETISLELVERHSGEDAAGWSASANTQSALLSMLLLPDSRVELPQNFPSLLRSGDPRVQRKALAVLYQRHARLPVNSLSESLHSPDARVRTLAVRLLQDATGEGARPLLQRAADDPDYFVKNTAQHVLAGQSDEQQLSTAECPGPTANRHTPAPELGVALLRGMTSSAFSGWPYVVYVPEDYGGDYPFPVVIYLGGGSGSALLTAAGNREIADQLGYIFVYPQAHGNWWEKDSTAMVHALINEVLKSYNVDTNRVYLTGFSNGATGAFDYATLWPDRFAAVSSLMGAGLQFPGKEPPLPISTINVPLLFLHGENDPIIPVEASRRTVEELRKLPRNADVELHTFKGKQHELDLENDEGRTIHFLEQHVRHPFPRQIMMQMRDLEYPRQYWVEIQGKSEGVAELRAEIADDNTIRLKSKNISRLRLLLRPELVKGDFRVVWNGKDVYSGTLKADCNLFQQSAAASADPDLAYSFEVPLTAP